MHSAGTGTIWTIDRPPDSPQPRFAAYEYSYCLLLAQRAARECAAARSRLGAAEEEPPPGPFATSLRAYSYILNCPYNILKRPPMEPSKGSRLKDGRDEKAKSGSVACRRKSQQPAPGRAQLWSMNGAHTIDSRCPARAQKRKQTITPGGLDRRHFKGPYVVMIIWMRRSPLCCEFARRQTTSQLERARFNFRSREPKEKIIFFSHMGQPRLGHD